jgi:hypothetical protein
MASGRARCFAHGVAVKIAVKDRPAWQPAGCFTTIFTTAGAIAGP